MAPAPTSQPTSPPAASTSADAAPAQSHDAAADRALLQRARSGERAAWNQMYARFSPAFQVLAIRLLAKHGPRIGATANRPYLEDLVQSVWQHILNRCQEIERDFDPDKGSLEGFLMVVARNQIYSQLRSSSRRPWKAGDDLESHPEAPTVQPSPESLTASREALSHLQTCIESELGPGTAQLLTRVLIDDEDVATIAAEQRVARNTLDKQISRARQQLRECMEKLSLKRSTLRSAQT